MYSRLRRAWMLTSNSGLMTTPGGGGRDRGTVARELAMRAASRRGEGGRGRELEMREERGVWRVRGRGESVGGG